MWMPKNNKQYKNSPRYEPMNEKEKGVEVKEKSEKEKRIRAITRLYYSNPKIQEVLCEFSKNREVVPRYFEGFGRRPDTLNYPSDVMGLVNKGATSFHASEEIWKDPLQINSEMDSLELNKLRKSWDLLIDIDSPFLDFSKIAARLLIEELEGFGIKSYGIKFSGSKGFHIVVPGEAFPGEHEGKLMSENFPEWPRAICNYLMNRIRPEFSRQTHNISNMGALAFRTNKKEEELLKIVCPQCGKPVKKDKWIVLKCDYCSNEVKQKRSVIARKRILRCENCLGVMNVINEEEFLECPECKITNISRFKMEDSKNTKYTADAKVEHIARMDKGLHEKDTGGFDLVLVAPRHLFRMPYSLHEKTALASVVLSKEEIEKFSPRDANPFNIKIKEYLHKSENREASRLLESALQWQRSLQVEEEKIERKKYDNYEKLDLKGITEEMFPKPIKKLLKGVKDGKKRGLFILITFLKSLNFPPEYINLRIREWNKLNEQPLKEGYVKSQIDWHLRQKKQILPPNYNNESFYKDLGLFEEMPKAKNPLVEVMRQVRKKEDYEKN